MTVYYRMCDIPSTNPSPILQDNKFELNKLCLRSFVQAFKDVKPTVIFINDYCGEEYREMIDGIVPFEHEQHFTALGINNTMLLSYELATLLPDDEVVLFQECDYLYLPDTGQTLEHAIKDLGLVSPYDHLNFYEDASIHSPYQKLTLSGGRHWRTAERNTMTFGLRAKHVKLFYDILAKYGYLDNEVWAELKDRGLPLWTPVPTLATHMVEDFLSPGIDWEKQLEQYL